MQFHSAENLILVTGLLAGENKKAIEQPKADLQVFQGLRGLIHSGCMGFGHDFIYLTPVLILLSMHTSFL